MKVLMEVLGLVNNSPHDEHPSYCPRPVKLCYDQ